MVVPQLRFKEFSGNWGIKYLGDSFTLVSGFAFPSSASVDNGAKWLKIADVGIQEMRPNNLSYLPLDYLDKYRQFIVNDNDYVIALTRPILNKQLKISKVGKFYDGALLNQRVAKIQTKENDLDFIYSLLQKSKTVEELDNSIAGTDPPNLSLNDVKEIKLAFPSKQEQTKIASFLSAVDEKISQLTEKHQLLSQYKQGMMQKLFSQQLRFKADDGSEFEKWEETSLHTFLCESLIKGSKGNKAKKLTVKLWGKGVIPKNEAFQGSENTQYYKRSAGQLIYGKLDFLNCAFGLIPEYLDGFESTIDAPAFDIDNKIVHPYFLINRFLQKDFYQKNGEEADGSRKAKRINQSVFLAMQIGLPSLEEQTKIANFLSAIDQKIEVMAQQIEQAKTWKKGLLQQMFV